jgi:Mg-chelatase subunit ChlD
MSKRIVAGMMASSIAICLASACGTGSDRGFDEPPGGSSGDGTSGGTSGTSGLGSSGASGTSGGGDSGLGTCAAETQSAKQSPLDIFIMLDTSGSMTAETGASGSPTRMAAVKSALQAFVGDPKSAGIGVGLQNFPITHAGAPASCTTSAQCTVGGTSYGKCFKKACPLVAGTAPKICDTPADCGGAACSDLGECTIGGIVGLGQYCVAGVASCGFLGSCSIFTAATCEGDACFASDYGQASVPIAALPGNAAALNTKIAAFVPSGGTPTSAAVDGGLTYSKQFAAANPGHAVVMVLATDGYPSQCDPTDAAGISAIAKAAAMANPSVKTFVIGVFPDAATTANLDAIAAAGGTTKSITVSSGANVTAAFQAALDGIRAQALPCEYAVPKPKAGTPDYDKVNVQFSSGAGAPALLGYKKSAAACDASGGWYYDVDPSGGGTPTKIHLCPTSCDGVKKGTSTAKLEILLGCKTIVK